MKIHIVKPSPMNGLDTENLVQAHFNEFTGMVGEVCMTQIQEAVEKNWWETDFFFVYKISDALSLVNAGIENYVFFLNEFEAVNVDSHAFLDCNNAIEKSLFTVCRSLDWIEVFKQYKNKMIYISWGYTHNSSLLSIKRGKIKPSETKFLCMGENGEQGEDFLNYVLANKFANKFGLSITFLNNGCSFFNNTEHKFFEANSKCSIICDSTSYSRQTIFQESKGDVDFLKNHDILLDLRQRNFEGLSSHYLNAMSTGMPVISTIAKGFGDRDNAIYHCNSNFSSIASAFKEVIDKWEDSVQAARGFAVRRNWFEICKILYSFLKLLKNGQPS